MNFLARAAKASAALPRTKLLYPKLPAEIGALHRAQIRQEVSGVRRMAYLRARPEYRRRTIREGVAARKPCQSGEESGREERRGSGGTKGEERTGEERTGEGREGEVREGEVREGKESREKGRIGAARTEDRERGEIDAEERRGEEREGRGKWRGEETDGVERGRNEKERGEAGQAEETRRRQIKVQTSDEFAMRPYDAR